MSITHKIGEIMYYIYHIPGVKIGCTDRIADRLNEQGYNVSDCEILEEHEDIYVASKRERELQKQYGYKLDIAYYYTSKKNAIKGNRISAKMPRTDKQYNAIKKCGLNNKGRKVSKDVKEKISNTLKGRKFTEFHKDKISNKLTGRKLTEAHKEKLSIKKKGVKNEFTSKLNSERNSNKYMCEHCGREIGGYANYKRFHSEKCKFNQRIL